ncbi:MAG: hypothetical protein R2792_03890 [Saprospiraceae bacterium]
MAVWEEDLREMLADGDAQFTRLIGLAEEEKDAVGGFSVPEEDGSGFPVASQGLLGECAGLLWGQIQEQFVASGLYCDGPLGVGSGSNAEDSQHGAASCTPPESAHQSGRSERSL